MSPARQPPQLLQLQRPKPRRRKEPTITLDQLRAQLAAAGVNDVELLQRDRVGRSEVITLRFPDGSRLQFRHADSNVKSPDAVRQAVISFVEHVKQKVEKAIDERVEQLEAARDQLQENGKP